MTLIDDVLTSSLLLDPVVTSTLTPPPTGKYRLAVSDTFELVLVDDALVETPIGGGGGGSGLYSAYLCYRDEKAQNTHGGTFTSGAWQTRNLNTEASDTGGFGSVASNQITLAAGTYRVQASAPALNVQAHQLRLRDITNGVTLVTGTSSYTVDQTTATGGSMGLLVGRFTIAGTTVIELQHQALVTCATFGFGAACNFGIEVYAVVELWKE